jgi:hypothetical protein
MIRPDSVAAVTVWVESARISYCYALRIRASLTVSNRFRSEVAMFFLPTFCPDCSGLTMEVVEHRPNDSYEAQCTACGCQTFGKISAELLITKHSVESTR